MPCVETIFEKYYYKNINKKIKISLNLYCKIQSIFCLKSLKKSNFEMINELKFDITIDNVLNYHIALEKKY
jgi:hypothetical protein